MPLKKVDTNFLKRYSESLKTVKQGQNRKEQMGQVFNMALQATRLKSEFETKKVSANVEKQKLELQKTEARTNEIKTRKELGYIPLISEKTGTGAVVREATFDEMKNAASLENFNWKPTSEAAIAAATKINLDLAGDQDYKQVSFEESNQQGVIAQVGYSPTTKEYTYFVRKSPEEILATTGKKAAGVQTLSELQDTARTWAQATEPVPGALAVLLDEEVKEVRTASVERKQQIYIDALRRTRAYIDDATGETIRPEAGAELFTTPEGQAQTTQRVIDTIPSMDLDKAQATLDEMIADPSLSVGFDGNKVIEALRAEIAKKQKRVDLPLESGAQPGGVSAVSDTASAPGTKVTPILEIQPTDGELALIQKANDLPRTPEGVRQAKDIWKERITELIHTGIDERRAAIRLRKELRSK